MQADILENISRMIHDFKELNLVNVQAERTFMQLTEYPHLENVCSNILAFFFDTEEKHSFENLFIRSLIECVNTKMQTYYTENVEREVSTDKGNRIDLVIETEKYIIAIENKVFCGVNNPLEDYKIYIDNLSNINDKEPVYILLTLKEEKVEGTAFVNITYSNFFKVIRKNIGDYIINANSKWILILNDFIRTIDELQGGTKLNKEFISFYNENEESISTLIEIKNNLCKSMKGKLKGIIGMTKFNKQPSDHYYYSSKNDCEAEYNATFNDVIAIESQVEIGIYINSKVCSLLIGIDKRPDSQMKLLKNKLSEHGFTYTDWDENNDYLVTKEFDIFEDNLVIAKEFEFLLNAIVE